SASRGFFDQVSTARKLTRQDAPEIRNAPPAQSRERLDLRDPDFKLLAMRASVPIMSANDAKWPCVRGFDQNMTVRRSESQACDNKPARASQSRPVSAGLDGP